MTKVIMKSSKQELPGTETIKQTVGMTLEQRARWVADGVSPVLDQSGHRWRGIYSRALIALQETVEEIERLRAIEAVAIDYVKWFDKADETEDWQAEKRMEDLRSVLSPERDDG